MSTDTVNNPRTPPLSLVHRKPDGGVSCHGGPTTLQLPRLRAVVRVESGGCSIWRTSKTSVVEGGLKVKSTLPFTSGGKDQAARNRLSAQEFGERGQETAVAQHFGLLCTFVCKKDRSCEDNLSLSAK
ncbi:hypothetical protein R1flu_018106 [Riccia fluitans]|uniref:Uncharacterized protein n=1 Tax=Riccia fluitans TaxID=41844 RepID=A0ABD1ZEW5_9MARC